MADKDTPVSTPVSDKPPASATPAAPKAPDDLEAQKKKLAASHPGILPAVRHTPGSVKDIEARKQHLLATQRAVATGAAQRAKEEADKKKESGKPLNVVNPDPAAALGRATSGSAMALASAKAAHLTATKAKADLESKGMHAAAATLDKHIATHAAEIKKHSEKLDEEHASRDTGAHQQLTWAENKATGTHHGVNVGDPRGDAGQYRVKKEGDKWHVYRRASIWETKTPLQKQTDPKTGKEGRARAAKTRTMKFEHAGMPPFESAESAKVAAQRHHADKQAQISSRAANAKAAIIHDTHDKTAHSSVKEINRDRKQAVRTGATEVAAAKFTPAPSNLRSGLSPEARAKVGELNRKEPSGRPDAPQFSKEAGNLRYTSPGTKETGPAPASPSDEGTAARYGASKTGKPAGGVPARITEYDKEGKAHTKTTGVPYKTQEDQFNDRWRKQLHASIDEHNKTNTQKSLCNCCHCDSIEKGEVTMSKFEDIFKSDCTCPDCGGEIRKGGKGKKGKGAKRLGNEMDPHRHKPAGSGPVKGPQVGVHKTGHIQRDAVQPKNPTVKKGEAPDLNKALFPCVTHFALATYAGLDTDASLAKSVEANLKPGAGVESGLFVPPARNLAMEQEINKAMPPQFNKEKDDDGDSDDSSSDSTSSESSEASDDGSSSEE